MPIFLFQGAVRVALLLTDWLRALQWTCCVSMFCSYPYDFLWAHLNLLLRALFLSMSTVDCAMGEHCAMGELAKYAAQIVVGIIFSDFLSCTICTHQTLTGNIFIWTLCLHWRCLWGQLHHISFNWYCVSWKINFLLLCFCKFNFIFICLYLCLCLELYIGCHVDQDCLAEETQSQWHNPE